MWSENSRGHLCIQVFGKTVLIGSGSDSTPLPCLCVYRKEMIQEFYFWLLLILCGPCFDTELMYCSLSDMATKSLPQSSHQHLLFFIPSFFFLRAWSLANPARYGTHTVFLIAGSYEVLWLCFIKLVLSWRINAVGNSHPSCLYDTHVAFIFIGMLC